MKKIRINFTDFYKDFNKTDNDFYRLLSKKYDVEISDKPEYLFFSCFGDDHSRYDCVKIFYTGECFSPDFTVCDYAIGFDRIEFGDRYLRVPLYMLQKYRESFLRIKKRKHICIEDVKKHDKFCSFVYSNFLANEERLELFRTLSKYKRVDSGGRYMNNIGGAVKNKEEFQSHYKFSIACENTKYPGYTTEKIVEAFAAGTIPIYYGDPYVGEDFNEKAFINCNRYHSFEEVLDVVKEIDNDQERCLEMLNQPIVIIEDQEERLQQFLYHIIEQPIAAAKRIPKSYWGDEHNNKIKRHRFFEKNIYKNYKTMINQIKRMFSHGVEIRKK